MRNLPLYLFVSSPFILVGLLIYGCVRQDQCSKKFCPKGMKPALVRDAGCICLIEAK